MAHVAEPTKSPGHGGHGSPPGSGVVPVALVTPGKVGIWLFLCTEIMFFTGLIGSYIVLRAGSPPKAYSNQFSPASDLEGREDTKAVRITSVGTNRDALLPVIEEALVFDKGQAWEVESKLGEIDRLQLKADEANKRKDDFTRAFRHEAASHLLEKASGGFPFGASPTAIAFGLTEEKAKSLIDRLTAAGAKADSVSLATYQWPKPYDSLTNPLSIDLTAMNTFILICSSVTMVLALSAFQQDKRRQGSLYLLATVLIGSTFLGVQVYEYYQLTVGHHYPPGVSATGHFRPDVSLFASCFFTMTGFHGAHVAIGVIALACIFLRSLTGAYTRSHYSPVELVGLYWHFVDLVWILLFTVVYLI